jgi:energy-coupling factor transporter ATP-binding protein EcfA2
MKTLIDELKGLDEEMAAKVEKFISEARTRQNTSISLSSLPCGYITVDWDESVIGEMETVAMAQVQKKINQFEELLRGKKPTEPIEKEISELRDLQKAFQNHDRIRNEIRRIKKVEALGECVRDTDTARITRKSGELSSVVTEALRESFSREVSALNVGRDLNISLEGRGASRGVARHQILLASSLQNVPVNEVLSEGEHRAIALSAFLTEVSLLTVNSGVVFDDPVSSLDHKRKSKIAKRLVEEAMRRQVVVFTHDLPFALELRRFAEEGATTPLSFRHLMPPMGTRGAGRSAEGLPWEGLSPERRLRELRDRMSRATAEYNAGNNELYNTMIVDIYRDLRITWERAVEEVLFYGVIKRFGRSVQTQKLSNVHITTEDNATVDRGMTKCSSFAHDPAIDDPPPVPEPDEVSGDIQSLQTWIETVKARRSS